MVWEVSPLDHSQESAGLASRSTLSPGQRSVAPEAVIVGVAGGVLRLTLVSAEAGLQQPLASVMRTVYPPAVFTLIVRMVSPLDHSQLLAGPASRSTLSPGQISVAPEGLIVGAEGGVFTVTSVSEEDALQQPAASLTCTE